MNRRSFFSILIAPLLARFAPKRLPVSGIAIVRGLDDELMKHGMFNPRTDVYDRYNRDVGVVWGHAYLDGKVYRIGDTIRVKTPVRYIGLSKSGQ